MAARVERLSERRRAEALAFLEPSPYENVFLIHAARFGGPSLQASLHVAIEGGRISGVAFFGRQVVMATRDQAALAAFAELGERYGRERMIVGPLAQVAAYWELVAPHHAPPRAVRERQPLLALTPARLRGESDRIVVRRAARRDLPAVVGNSALMIEGELGYDPRDRGSADFEAGVEQMIERGLWWIGEDPDGICLILNVGPYSDRTAQLQGIFSPPQRRGRGLATASLAGICRRLFDDVPTLSLFVNDFNGPALRLYERTGFEEVGAFRSILF